MGDGEVTLQLRRWREILLYAAGGVSIHRLIPRAVTDICLHIKEDMRWTRQTCLLPDMPALAAGSSFIQAVSLIGNSKGEQMFALNTCTFRRVFGLFPPPELVNAAPPSRETVFSAGLSLACEMLQIAFTCFKAVSIFRVHRNA